MSENNTLSNTARTKRKRKPRKALTPKQWIQLRELHECHNYTFKTLADTWGISEDAIKHRSMKENWSQRKLSEAIQKKIEESTIEIFARKGMTKEHLLELYAQAAEKSTKSIYIREISKDDFGNPIKTKTGRVVYAERSVLFPDNDIMLRNRQEISKLCGYYSAPKSPVQADDTPDVPIPIVSNIKPQAIPQAQEASK